MATKQHNLMSGVDLHVNKIDATTGTELTTPSEGVYDARWVKTTGGTISGTITISDNSTNAAMTVAQANIGGNGIKITAAQNQYWLSGWVGASEYFRIFRDPVGVQYQSFNSAPLRINPQGNNVAVGNVSSPTSVLHVGGAIATAITTRNCARRGKEHRK